MAEEKEKAPVAVKPPAGKTVDIIPSSEVVGEGEKRRLVPKVVKVSSEADMTPELIFKGPEKNKGINSYVTVDGKKLRFDGKTGLLLSLLLAALLAVFSFASPAYAQYGVGPDGAEDCRYPSALRHLEWRERHLRARDASDRELHRRIHLSGQRPDSGNRRPGDQSHSLENQLRLPGLQFLRHHLR